MITNAQTVQARTVEGETTMSDRKIIYLNDAIDALEKVARFFPYRVPGNRDSYDRYNEAWNDAIGRAEIEIEKLPSVQPEERTEERTKTHACDLISRQAAIEKINANLMYLYTYGADRCSELIEELPSVQPEPLWHECFEDDPSSFPDNDRLVLISVKNYSDPAIGWYQHNNDGGGYWTFGSEMPLTEFGLFVEGWWELPRKPRLKKQN